MTKPSHLLAADLREKLESLDICKFLDYIGDMRLVQKKTRMKNLLKIANHDEALYREIMLALGYKNNKVQFQELAMILPYGEIRRLDKKEVIEKALLYRAGFLEEKGGLPKDFDFSLKMHKSVWRYKGTRPQNFPEVRIKKIAGFLFDTSKDGIYNFFENRISESALKDVDIQKAIKITSFISQMKGIGKSRRLEIFFNIILPFYLVIFEKEGKRDLVNFLYNLYSFHPALEDNSVTKSMKKELFAQDKKAKEVVNSARRYMGLIQFYNVKRE